MVTLRILFALAIAISVVALTGCDDNNSELERSAISVSAVNEAGIYVCASLDAGQNRVSPDPPGEQQDDFVPFAHMPVRVKNRPYNEFITNPDYSPFGDFHITAVRVEWVRMVSGDPARLAQIQAYDFESNYDIVVPSGSEVTFEVLMVPFYALLEAPLVDIVGNSRGTQTVDPFVAEARLTLIGHDSGSTRDIEVVGGTMVEFVGLIISDR